MKTKISSKNKNVINIKINTEKKEKKRRRRVVKRGSSGGGGGNNNNGGGGGYGQMPPIIIQPHRPMVFPQYNNQPEFINPVRNTNKIINHTQTPVQTPVHTPHHHPIEIPVARLVTHIIDSSPYTINNPFINFPFTTPIPIAQSIPKKWKHSVVEKNNDFINDTSTHPSSIRKAIEEETDKFEDFYTPQKERQPTPNLKSLQNYYNNNDNDDDEVFSNPISSIKELSKEPKPTSFEMNKKRNETSRARYHSKTEDYSVDNFNTLLHKYNTLTGNEKPDSDFEGKNPSKTLFSKLVSKVNKVEKKDNHYVKWMNHQSN